MANEIKITFGSFALDMTNNITVSKIEPKETKNVKTTPIPKTDGSVAEIARRSSLILTLEGDVGGSDYDDLRFNMDALKVALHNGFQKLTIDDDRYIIAQLKDFTDPYIVTRQLAHWSASFAAHYPFWLAIENEYTKLCSHFDGADGAIAYIDPIAGAYTFAGSAQLDIAQSKFGGASLKLGENVLNGKFEVWSGGANSAPDDWTFDFTGGSVARESGIVKLGTYSMKCTRVTSDGKMYQDISTAKGINYWKGKTVTFGCWVYATVAGRARLRIYGGAANYAYSSYHTGDSTWQWLIATITVGAGATNLYCMTYIDSGDTSAYFDGASLIDNSTDFITLPYSVNWTFGSGNFSEELRLKFSKVGTAFFIDQTNVNAWTGFYYNNADNTLNFNHTNAANLHLITFKCSWVPVADVWYHLALVRNGNTWYIFIDGVSQILTLVTGTYAATLEDIPSVLRIGSDGSVAYCLNGWIDELRISKGIARWTSDFTPPTSAYSSPDSRVPTSGVGYIITNNGNASTRVKIEVTAPAGGIADALKIENQTNGLSFQYRGTVNAGDIFVADNRYDTDDLKILNDDVDAIVDFEGDFIELAPGANTIVFTGTAGSLVKISHRDTWY